MIRFFLTAAAVATLRDHSRTVRLSSHRHAYIEVTITDNGEGTGTTTWTCDNNYILDGYVFVNADKP